MAVAFFEVSEPRDGSTEPEPQRNKQRLILKDMQKDEMPSTEVFVNDFFQKFDKNRDDVVEPHETSLAFRKFGFRNYDEDRDGKLSRDEIRSAAQRRQKR